MRRFSYFMYIPGAFFSLFPIGLCLVLFTLFLVVPNAAISITCFWLAVLLALIGMGLWLWSPRWTRPYWMRDEFER